MDTDDLGDVPADSAVAAYVAVATIVSAAGAAARPLGRVRCRVRRSADGLIVVVRVLGSDKVVDAESSVDAADRVGALGGTWHVVQGGGHLDLEAVIPCGS